jgi:DNA-binding CsgD family transcriptional regulator
MPRTRRIPPPASAGPPISALLDSFGGRFPGHAMQRMRLPDGRYRYTYVSPGVGETFGLDPAALLAADSVTHEWLPEPDRGNFLAALERSAATLTTFDQEVRVVRPGRPVRWVRSIGHPRRLRDGSVVWDGVALDVTDRHEAQAAVQAALEAARRREASGAGLAAVALSDLARPLAGLRDEIAALGPRRAAAARARLDELEAAIARAVALLRAGDNPAAGAGPGAGLTARQREIRALLRDGLSNRDIATRLGLAEGTVKLHVSALLRRMGARNRTEAALRD